MPKSARSRALARAREVPLLREGEHRDSDDEDEDDHDDGYSDDDAANEDDDEDLGPDLSGATLAITDDIPVEVAKQTLSFRTVPGILAPWPPWFGGAFTAFILEFLAVLICGATMLFVKVNHPAAELPMSTVWGIQTVSCRFDANPWVSWPAMTLVAVLVEAGLVVRHLHWSWTDEEILGEDEDRQQEPSSVASQLRGELKAAKRENRALGGCLSGRRVLRYVMLLAGTAACVGLAGVQRYTNGTGGGVSDGAKLPMKSKQGTGATALKSATEKNPVDAIFVKGSKLEFDHPPAAAT